MLHDASLAPLMAAAIASCASALDAGPQAVPCLRLDHQRACKHTAVSPTTQSSMKRIMRMACYNDHQWQTSVAAPTACCMANVLVIGAYMPVVTLLQMQRHLKLHSKANAHHSPAPTCLKRCFNLRWHASCGQGETSRAPGLPTQLTSPLAAFASAVFKPRAHAL